MKKNNNTAPDSRRAYGEENFTGRPSVDVACLLLFATLLSTWGLDGGPGLGLHEAIVAQGAREMREGGSWLVPTVNEIPEIRKPPLEFWFAALSSWIVDPSSVSPPVSELAARLPSAVAAVATTAVVFALGGSMFGHRTGLLCGMVMASSAGGLFYSHNAQVEMELTFFMTASFAFFWFATETRRRRRFHMAAFYVSFAVAMLAKAPLPLALVGLPLAVWWFVTVPLARLDVLPQADAPYERRRAVLFRQIRRVRELWLPPGLVLFLLVFLPWPIYAYLKVPHALDLWNIQFLGRYSGELRSRPQPFWYYVPIALALLIPYSLSLPEAVASPFLRVYAHHRKGLLFALTWVVVQILFLSTSAFKRPHYLIGCVPGLCLLLGPVLERLFLAARSFSKQRQQAEIAVLHVALLLGLGIGTLLIRRDYPDLMGAYAVVAIILLFGVIGACIAFVGRRRILSLVVLLGTTAGLFTWSWLAIGRSHVLNRKVEALVEQLRAHAIGPEDRLTWAAGRLDNRVPYYAGRPIPPLFSPMELAARRGSPRDLPEELVIEGAKRIRERLAGDRPEYLILDARDWERLGGRSTTAARVVFRVPDPDGDADDAWIVVTNKRNGVTPRS